MASSLFVDLESLDLSQVLYDVAAIEAVNPQRGDMRQLDGICWADLSISTAIGFKDVRADEFWVPGHIPGRPLLPGVMMIEAAAQLAAFMMKTWRDVGDGFLGFIGCTDVKFRGQVVPGDRLYLIGRENKFTKRRFIADVQGVTHGKLVFEATVTGMPI